MHSGQRPVVEVNWSSWAPDTSGNFLAPYSWPATPKIQADEFRYVAEQILKLVTDEMNDLSTRYTGE